MYKTKKHEDGSGDAEDVEEYTVQAVKDMRIRNGKEEFLVKWCRYHHSENTWEPVANLDCPDLIKAFKDELRKKTEKRKRRTQEEGSAKKRKMAAETKNPEDGVGDAKDVEDEYTVESVKGTRFRNGKEEFLLKWRGFHDSENTWESVDNLDCPILIREFKDAVRIKKIEKQRQAVSLRIKEIEEQRLDKEEKAHAKKKAAENKQFIRDLLISIYKPTENVNPEIKEWFKSLDNAIKNSKAHSVTPITVRGSLSQQILLLRECLLSHRWSQATAVLSSLIRTPSACRHVIHRAGTEIMYNASPDSHEILEQFLNQVKQLRHVVPVDVVLEFAMYLFMVGRAEAASKAIKERVYRRTATDLHNDLQVNVHHLHSKASAHENDSDKRYMCYMGITRYYEYRIIKAGIDDRHMHNEDGDGTYTSDSEYPMMLTKANEAIDCFTRLLNQKDANSCWDNVIIALVELLEFQEQDQEALDVLQSYAERNPDNPNAFRYLMQYYQRHGKPDQELIFMQQFCDAVPSDEMSLLLYERLVAKGCPTSETLHLLFDLLDYSDWAAQIKPWSLLATQLERIVKSGNGDDASCLDECWSARKSWWPAFHLTTKDAQQPILLVHKARVAAVLTGHECAFVKKVLECGFELKELKYLRHVIKHLQKTTKS